jgi:hypothetical protein
MGNYIWVGTRIGFTKGSYFYSMSNSSQWPKNLLDYIFDHRYIMIILVILSVIDFGFFICMKCKHWTGKDTRRKASTEKEKITKLFSRILFSFLQSMQ